VTLVPFGYKFGHPDEADITFDVRFLPNPYYVDELRDLTGHDAAVGAFLERLPETRTFLQHAESLLGFFIPRFMHEGKTNLTIAVGCTGGRHRSVYLAERLREFLGSNPQLDVAVTARDIDK
jgi:RNase adapter protein RapZ